MSYLFRQFIFNLFKRQLQKRNVNNDTSGIRRWDSNLWPLRHEFPLITTTPWLLPFGKTSFSFYLNFFLFSHYLFSNATNSLSLLYNTNTLNLSLFQHTYSLSISISSHPSPFHLRTTTQRLSIFWCHQSWLKLLSVDSHILLVRFLLNKVSCLNWCYEDFLAKRNEHALTYLICSLNFPQQINFAANAPDKS